MDADARTRILRLEQDRQEHKLTKPTGAHIHGETRGRRKCSARIGESEPSSVYDLHGRARPGPAPCAPTRARSLVSYLVRLARDAAICILRYV